MAPAYKKGDRVEFRFSAADRPREGAVTVVETDAAVRYWIRPDGTRQQFPIAARNVLRQIDIEITMRHPGLDIEAEIARVQAQKGAEQLMKSRG